MGALLGREKFCCCSSLFIVGLSRWLVQWSALGADSLNGYVLENTVPFSLTPPQVGAPKS